MKILLQEILGNNYSRLNRIHVKGAVWYRAKSVCDVLGLKNTSVSVRGTNVHIGYFGIEQKDIYKDGNYKCAPLYISEAGVFKLILKSRKPSAYAIKKRLSEKVLIEIMRTGGYKKKRLNCD